MCGCGTNRTGSFSSHTAEDFYAAVKFVSVKYVDVQFLRIVAYSLLFSMRRAVSRDEISTNTSKDEMQL
jgi:hypothetical protein